MLAALTVVRHGNELGNIAKESKSLFVMGFRGEC